jgi:hypothetical protein
VEFFIAVTAWQTWAYDRNRRLLQPQKEKLVLRIGVKHVVETAYKCQEKHSSFSPDLIHGGDSREASRAVQKTCVVKQCRERPFIRSPKSRHRANNSKAEDGGRKAIKNSRRRIRSARIAIRRSAAVQSPVIATPGLGPNGGTGRRMPAIEPYRKEGGGFPA